MTPSDPALARPRRAPQARAIQTRHRILEAAREIISTRGFEETRTQDIAQMAGVAEGSVFAHFGNKQGLLGGLIESHYANLITQANQIQNTQTNAVLRLTQLVEMHLENLLASWQLVRVFAHYGRYSDTAVARVFQEMNREYTRIFQSCLNELIETGVTEPSLRADLLRDMVFGSAEHWAFRVRELDQPLKKDEAVTFLIGRVLAKKTKV